MLLTTFEFLMGKHDRPRLSRLQWKHIVVDEGHRLKNAGCKLNAELKHYKAKCRLLLTGACVAAQACSGAAKFACPDILSDEDFVYNAS